MCHCFCSCLFPYLPGCRLNLSDWKVNIGLVFFQISCGRYQEKPLVFSASRDKTIKLWLINDDFAIQLKSIYEGHDLVVTAIDHNSGKKLSPPPIHTLITDMLKFVVVILNSIFAWQIVPFYVLDQEIIALNCGTLKQISA